MNNSINIANTSTPNTNDVAASAGKKTARNGADSTDTADLAASAESFHDSIKKAYDKSQNAVEAENSGNKEIDADGNTLPLADDFPEIAAQDDRSLLPGNLYLSGQLPASNTATTSDENIQVLTSETELESSIEDAELALLSASSTTPVSTDKTLNSDGKLNEISSQLRQFVNAESKTETKNPATTQSLSTRSNADSASQNTDNALIQQTDTVTLKTELTGLSGDKAGVLLNTAGQQQLSQNIQTSLLLQAATAQGDTASETTTTLPGIASASTNSPSTTNPLTTTLPPAGITETFGRPAWSQGMGKQVMMMVNQNINTAEIRLNPSHLGPIEVFIDMSDDQVSVSLSSRHPMVRDAMEQALPKLREMLEQNGFSLADADISKHSFAEQREQNTDDDKKGFASSNTDQPAITEVNGQMIKQTVMSNSMVDYYI